MTESGESKHPLGYDPDDYPEGHSPFCRRSCDHPCHDGYDIAQAADISSQGGSDAAT